jgi:hypothetical protein
MIIDVDNRMHVHTSHQLGRYGEDKNDDDHKPNPIRTSVVMHFRVRTKLQTNAFSTRSLQEDCLTFDEKLGQGMQHSLTLRRAVFAISDNWSRLGSLASRGACCYRCYKNELAFWSSGPDRVSK